MKIDVYFEIENKFRKRVSQGDKSFHLNEFLRDVGLLTASTISDSTSVLDVEKYKEMDTCIIDMSDTVGLKSFVFEQMESFVKILDAYGIGKIVVNNPSKLLLSSISKFDNVTLHKGSSFRRITDKQIQRVQNSLSKNIIGQKRAKTVIFRKLVVQKIRNRSKPLVLMFYGKPGIGKTEVAKQISKAIYGSSEVLREQMSMVGGANSLEYFKATGHSEDAFSKKLLNRKTNLILLDEFGLAPEYVQTAFFQLFDEGIYVDQNYEVNMHNSIIICTTNLMTREKIYSTLGEALVSRFDALVPFVDFSEVEKDEISHKLLEEYMKHDLGKKYASRLDKHQVLKTLKLGIGGQNNFRDIKNLIEDVIAETLIENGLF